MWVSGHGRNRVLTACQRCPRPAWGELCRECYRLRSLERRATTTALLRVTGKTFCAGIVFVKVDGEWLITDCAPYLRRVIAGTQPRDIGRLLRDKGFKYEWL